VVATLLEPTYGEVWIAGHDTAVQPAAARAVLGYMPDLAPVYDDVKVWEMLDVFARAYGVPRRRRAARVSEVLEAVDLEGKRHTMAGTLSRGMTQRLVLAKTLLHEPRVMLLDEPASGLDPLSRIELRDLLKRLAARGTTVLVSSHILTELSGFCTSIGVMEKGRMVAQGSIDELVAVHGVKRQVVIELLEDAVPHTAGLAGFVGVVSVQAQGCTMTVGFDGDERDAAALLTALVTQGLAVKSFYEKKMDVQDILLSVGAREVS